MAYQTFSFAGVEASPRASVSPRPVRIWLWTVIALIFLMVCVGGATRLTESGLSITQWKPITGVLPPLGESGWRAEFDRYKQIPQYSSLNPDMTLSGFKTIYAWEWGHRLLARVIGAAFILPALWFWRRGQLKGALGPRVALAAGFLALEPVVGWWMVSSGLSERVEVSQDRLALHLLIAAATFATLIAALVGTGARRRERLSPRLVLGSGALALLIFAQLGLGALVAGLRGGLLFNTWPLMDGQFIPDSVFSMIPWARSMLDDAGTAQFDHRILAYLICLAALAQAFGSAKAAAGTASAKRAAILALLALAQGALGIITVVLAAPLPAALAHQAMAMLLFGMAVAHWRANLRDSIKAPGGA
jgi:cytochrome c oxidase assembly protein subunit 15